MKDKLEKETITQKPMLTIITPTNKSKYMDDILLNFLRQDYPNKELIIILNDDSMDIETYQKKINKIDNIYLFKLPGTATLGACKNYGIKHAHGDYIVMFDDDDYFGEYFLTKAYNALVASNADIVGKACAYFYFKNSGFLALRFKGYENVFVKWVNDSGTFAKKSIFQKVSYRDMTAGVDTSFFEDCKKINIKIFALDRYDYAVIRNDTTEHTWEIQEAWFNEAWFLESFMFIAKTDNFYPYTIDESYSRIIDNKEESK